MRPPRIRLRTLMIAVAVAAIWLGITRAAPLAGYLLFALSIPAVFLTRRMAATFRARGEQVAPLETASIFLIMLIVSSAFVWTFGILGGIVMVLLSSLLG